MARDGTICKRQRGFLGAAWRLYASAAALLVTAQLFFVGLGFPENFFDWMLTRDESPVVTPAYIVVLGGAGIPSESGLVRTYYAADYGRQFTGATCIVSLPCEGDPETNSVGRMKQELIMRGIEAGRIRMEYRGWNTHWQAAEIAKMLGTNALREPILIVTSPYHCRRSLLCFRKQGFTQAGCMPAEDTFAEANPGENTCVRYGLWSSLDWQLRFARELCALAYYKLRGWV